MDLSEKHEVGRLTIDWTKEGQVQFTVPTKFNHKDTEETDVDHYPKRHPGFIERAKSLTKFCTKSSYEGNYNALGFSGFGEYIYPHGVRYEGTFKDGMFHGRGTLEYPLGQAIEGIWRNGKLINYIYKFSDGLEYYSPWKYCRFPNRKFQSENLDGLHSAGEEYLTNKQPTKQLKDGCYDTVDGFFDPTKNCVFKHEYLCIKLGAKTYYCKQNPESLRVCMEQEEVLIKSNYRKSEDEPVGYRPDLYENWTTGERLEMEAIERNKSQEDDKRVHLLYRSFSRDLDDDDSDEDDDVN